MNKSLATVVAAQREAKADQCFAASRKHGLNPMGLAYVRQGFFWLRAARRARAGDVQPVTYQPGDAS